MDPRLITERDRALVPVQRAVPMDRATAPVEPRVGGPAGRPLATRSVRSAAAPREAQAAAPAALQAGMPVEVLAPDLEGVLQVAQLAARVAEVQVV